MLAPVEAIEAAPVTAPLTDRFGRVKRKLRVSLTDRCNFRCRYCMPDRPVWLPKAELLRREETVALVELFLAAGVREVRLTGGEPLLRPDLEECVAALDGLRPLGLERLSMTTNASRLASRLEALVAAGLDDLNISLDALTADRFRALRGGEIAPVLAGIEEALALGVPVKVNTVLVRDQNREEIVPLVEWAMDRGIPLRFIEYMPLDAPGTWSADQVVGEAEILRRLARRYRVERLPRGPEPAALYRLDGGYRLGVVSTITNPFCASCDRVRLTANGELYTCLFAERGTPLGARLRAGAGPDQLTAVIRDAVWNKDAGYRGPVERPIRMHGLGG
jgi:cyclic pyranopterin phosphate synthase